MSRRDIWVIVAIWIAVVFATGAFADALGVSDDEAEGWGLLGLIVGGLLTAVYLLVREIRTKRKTGRLSLSMSESEQTTTPSQGHRSRTWVHVVVVLVLWIGGGIAAQALFSNGTSDWVSYALPLAYLLFLLLRRLGRRSADRGATRRSCE
jgi:hypothetical protein